MDLLTQGLLGSAMAQSGAQQKEVRLATGIGFFSGLLADADILIQSSNDPLLNIEFHRHFTHSLFFVPFGALVAALLLWPFVRKRLAFRRIYLFAFLGYLFSGVLDAFTSYGTHLLWPLDESRIAFNTISVVDPVFTIVLLIAVIYAFKKHTKIAARTGLVLAAFYLSFGWAQLQRAEAVAQTLANDRGHVIEELLVKPTLANLVLWRSIYQVDGRLYVDAIRVGLFSDPHVYEGESIEKFVVERDMAGLSETSVLAEDIRRFTNFSAGLVAIQPEQPNVLIDVRYSNLPTTVAPLWAIEMDRENPEEHAKYTLFRDASNETREKFLSLLLGRTDE